MHARLVFFMAAFYVADENVSTSEIADTYRYQASISRGVPAIASACHFLFHLATKQGSVVRRLEPRVPLGARSSLKRSPSPRRESREATPRSAAETSRAVALLVNKVRTEAMS